MKRVQRVRNEDGTNVLVFAQERQVEEDLEGLGVGSEDDHLRDTTIEGLGGFVGTLADLLVVRRLLNQVLKK